MSQGTDSLRWEADLRVAAARRLLSAALCDWPGDPFVIAAADQLLEQAQRFSAAADVDHWAVAA